MIRKVIIVVLTLAAVATMGGTWRSYSKVLRYQIDLTDLRSLMLYCDRGYVRLFWFYSDREYTITVDPEPPKGAILLPKSTGACDYTRIRITSPEMMRQAGLSTLGICWNGRLSSTVKGCTPID